MGEVRREALWVHSCPASSAVEPGDGQMGNVGRVNMTRLTRGTQYGSG